MQEIQAILQQLLNDLTRAHLLKEIDKIWLFGSRARHDETERSDIDLAILCPKLALSQWYKVVEVIEDLPTLLVFDVIRYEEVSSELQQRIQEEGMIIYE
jgi:uncharacterized protein